MASKTIKPAGGGDYTLLSLWASATSGLAGTQDAVCYPGALGSMLVTTWSPTSTTISCDATGKHTGIDNGTTGLAFFTTMEIDAGTNWTVQDLYSTRYVHVSPTFNGTMTTLVQRCLLSSAGADASMLSAVVADDGTSNPATLNSTFRNNVLINKGGGAAKLFTYAASLTSGAGNTVVTLNVELDTNTCFTSASMNQGIKFEIGAFAVTDEAVLSRTVQGNAVFGATSCFPAIVLDGGGGLETEADTAYQNNASSDATADDVGNPGDHNLINQSSATWFTSTPTDFRLKAGSPGINAWADPTTLVPGGFSDDIVGVTRPVGSHWDIGAFESALGASAGSNIILGIGRILGD